MTDYDPGEAKMGEALGRWLYRWYVLPLMIFALIGCVTLYVRKYESYCMILVPRFKKS